MAFTGFDFSNVSLSDSIDQLIEKVNEENSLEIIFSAASGALAITQLFPTNKIVFIASSVSLIDTLKENDEHLHDVKYESSFRFVSNLLSSTQNTNKINYDMMMIVNDNDLYTLVCIAFWQYLVELEISVPKLILLTPVTEDIFSSTDYFADRTAPSFIATPSRIPLRVERPFEVTITSSKAVLTGPSNRGITLTIVEEDDYAARKEVKNSYKKIGQINYPNTLIKKELTLTPWSSLAVLNPFVQNIIDRTADTRIDPEKTIFFERLGVQMKGTLFLQRKKYDSTRKSNINDLYASLILRFLQKPLSLEILALINRRKVEEITEFLQKMDLIEVENEESGHLALTEKGFFVANTQMNIRAGSFVYEWINNSGYPALPGIILAATIDQGSFVRGKDVPRELRGNSIIETLLNIWVQVVSDQVETIEFEEIRAPYVVKFRLFAVIKKVRKVLSLLVTKPEMGIFRSDNVIEKALPLLETFFPVAKLIGKGQYLIGRKKYARQRFDHRVVKMVDSPVKIVALSISEAASKIMLYTATVRD